MLTAPDRPRLEGVSSAVNVAAPGPAPLSPAVMRTHGTAEAAVQVQPGAVLTAKETDPPAQGKL